MPASIKFGTLIGTPSPSVERIIARARMAEENRFSTFWIADHLVSVGGAVPEAWTILALVACATKSIKIGSAVSDPHRRHPAVMAQTVATLDQFSGGRVMFGMGAGEPMNTKPFGIEGSRSLRKMVEYVDILRKLWAGEVIDYHGRYFNLKKAFIQIKPFKGPPPIYLAANGPKSRRLVGKIADGWIPVWSTPKLYRKEILDVKEGLQEAGRRLEDIDRVLYAFTAVSADRKQAVDSIARFRQIYASFPSRIEETYGITLNERFSFEKRVFTPELVKEFGRIDIIPIEAVEDFNIVGTVSDCIEQIARFVKAGVTHFALLNLGPNVAETYRTYGNEIIPRFTFPG